MLFRSKAIHSALALSAAFCHSLENINTINKNSILAYVRQELLEIDSPYFDIFKNFQLSSWEIPNQGISLDPIETLMAVIWCVSKSGNCFDAIKNACSLGGDTDTVAALSASLYIVFTGNYETFFSLDWTNYVDWNGIPNLEDAIQQLLNRNET